MLVAQRLGSSSVGDGWDDLSQNPDSVHDLVHRGLTHNEHGICARVLKIIPIQTVWVILHRYRSCDGVPPARTGLPAP